MHITIAILVLQYTLCVTIKVPLNWNDESVVNPLTQDKPSEYFHYTANKPQFAVDVAKFHDVKSPEKHYQSYPINPHTGVIKPEFGKHHILDSRNINYKPHQEFVNNENHGLIKPVSNYYEVYHPYQAEVPFLQEIYKDPVLNKIRNDVRDSKTRLQKYEHDTGKSDIHKDEYLEHPDHTDIKKVPHRNTPAQFENHKALRRPVYYQRVPLSRERESFLNKKLRHPWNQSYAKITPMHYNQLKNNLYRLRQQHALTYDDERNEYPQILHPERYAEEPDGYDIFEKGQDKYKQIRNNFDESVNKAVVNNRPVVNDKLELQKEDYNHPENTEEVFVPIKNYAQVRKTETYKHLPKSAALEDAKNLEEIHNAPRLREAIKSSKNQVVYSEEGYEDSAYDHAGEQKHASDHEGHGGFLKENEVSKGKFKIPSVDIGYADKGQSASRDQVLHGEKWNNEYLDTEDGNESEGYSDNEDDYSHEADIEDTDSDEFSERNKRESNATQVANDSLFNHEVTKREVFSNSSLPVQIINLKNPIKNKTFSEKDIENLNKKYPYYFKGTKILNQNSPLRYSENLKLIPKKNIDESAFYNSRIALECPDVESDINPVPEKFKNDKVSDGSENENYDDNEQGEEEFKNFKNKQRLKGLGDKIDCLKVKYFGEDPLDSPFFQEKSILNPLPLTKPKSKIFSVEILESKAAPVKLNNINVLNQKISLPAKENNVVISSNKQHDNEAFYTLPSLALVKVSNNLNNIPFNAEPANLNLSYINYTKNVTRLPFTKRKKRAATFMYEPYKVIKESQSPDSKRPAVSSNISPLIKKLQIRQIIDKTSLNDEKKYKDIGKNDRPTNLQKAEFIDVSMDQRRGEPRYELDLKNHRPHYRPSENKTSISLEDYKAKVVTETSNTQRDKKSRNSFYLTPTNRPHFDVSKYLPQTQNIAASNTVPKIIQSTTPASQADRDENSEEDDYEEYEDDEVEDEVLTTTTTTKRPVSKKRIRISPVVKPKDQNDSMKLHLVTRFHTSTTDTIPVHTRTQPDKNKFVNKEVIRSPKFREKNKKTTKSTLVTDTDSYGDDDDDMRKEEIDAMIGVKQDMDEYMPMYEKNEKHKHSKENNDHNIDDEEDDVKVVEDSDEYVDDDDGDDDDSDDSFDDKYYNNDHHFENNNRYIKQENSEQNQDHKTLYNTRDNKNVVNINEKQSKLETTTSEPTKRTLIKTTEPTSTTEVLLGDPQPTIFRRKVEIHKEFPINRTSPHMTHFEQDIKEVEIIKELDNPQTKLNHDHEDLKSLNLYKDENLAKEINNLGDIEIFKDDLDFENDQRHGGNYRSIITEVNPKSSSDIVTSETETKKVIDLYTSTSRPGLRSGNIQSRNKSSQNNNQGDLNEAKVGQSRTAMKTPNTMARNGRNRVNSERSAKLIELQSSENLDDSRSMHGGNYKESSTRDDKKAKHGGNYRSAELIRSGNSQQVSAETTTKRENNVRKRSRKTEAELLNRYANAISIITTTPAYILDPSKRMYYYVEK